MSSSILVAYATKYGSTQEVAEAIAATLREGGLAVDLQLLRQVKTLEGYGAVVMGAPLYMFRWHKDAKSFLSRHREALTKRPAAVFALGPTEDTPKDWQEVRSGFVKPSPPPRTAIMFNQERNSSALPHSTTAFSTQGSGFNFFPFQNEAS